MKNAGLEEAQTGIKIAQRNINNLRYGDGEGQESMACCVHEVAKSWTQLST